MNSRSSFRPPATYSFMSPTDTVRTATNASVTASGNAVLGYQWRRNGISIPGATLSSYTTPALSLADSLVQYSVVVFDAAGSVTSAGLAPSEGV